MNFYNKNIFKLDQSGHSLAIYSKNTNLIINKRLIKNLKNFSKRHNNCNLRICFHKNKKEALQNMVVLLNLHSGNKFKIHKHNFKDEVYQIIDGKLKIKIFSNQKVKKEIILSKETNLIARLEKNTFHQTLPQSNIVIFHEIRKGPFSGKDSIFRT
jgi:cupin fold WbuC family metalloprotein